MKKKLARLIVFVIVFSGCTANDDNENSGLSLQKAQNEEVDELLLPQMDIQGNINQGETFPIRTVKEYVPREEVVNRVEDCAGEYDNDERPIQIREKELIKCITSKVREELRGEFPYIKFNVDARASRSNFFHDFENVEFDGNVGAHMIVPITGNDHNSLLFQTGVDIFVRFYDVLSEREPSHLARFGHSAGLIYRFSIGPNAIGINLFYDFGNTLEGNHYRAGAGLDYSDGVSDFSVNIYYPLTGWFDVENDDEMTLGGFDISYEKALNKVISFYTEGEFFFLNSDFSASDEVHVSTGMGIGIRIGCNHQARVGIDLGTENFNFNDLSLKDFDLGAKLGFRLNHYRDDCTRGKPQGSKTRGVSRSRVRVTGNLND